MIKRRRLELPDTLVTQIQMFAPEHPVRMAPVFRAIRAPRRGLMPHNSLMYKSAISFSKSDMPHTDEFVHACIEAITSNSGLTSLKIIGDIDIRVTETAFNKSGIRCVSYFSHDAISVQHRGRLRDAFVRLQEIEDFSVSVNRRSIRNLDWDDVVSKVLLRSSSHIQDLSLCLFTKTTGFPKIQDALLSLPYLTSLEIHDNMFEFRPEVDRLYLRKHASSDVCGLIRSGKCDNMSCLSVNFVDFDSSCSVCDLVSEVASLVRRSKTLRLVEFLTDDDRDDAEKDDGEKLAGAIRASTSLWNVLICTNMFSGDAIDLIRAACDKNGRVDFDLHDY
jgi:hypothetical protein